METIQRTLEVERVSNLVMGFGWHITEVKTDGDKLVLTMEKTIPPFMRVG